MIVQLKHKSIEMHINKNNNSKVKSSLYCTLKHWSLRIQQMNKQHRVELTNYSLKFIRNWNSRMNIDRSSLTTGQSSCSSLWSDWSSCQCRRQEGPVVNAERCSPPFLLLFVTTWCVARRSQCADLHCRSSAEQQHHLTFCITE